MQRIIISVCTAAIFFCAWSEGECTEKGAAGANFEKYMIQSEYKNDVLEYDDETRSFYRQRGTLVLSRRSSFDFAHIYADREKESLFTWALILGDLYRGTEFYLGNFTANFGAGLLMGSKKFISSDPFASGLVISTGRVFKPRSNGNPLYSFSGIASGFSRGGNFFRGGIHFFYSIRNRYVSDDVSEQGSVSAGIDSINSRLESGYDYSAPALIHDSGMMLEFTLCKNIILQAYCAYTFLEMTNSEYISWNMKSGGLYETGVKDFLGYGSFVQYSDNSINIFCEFSRAERNIIQKEAQQKRIGDFGFLYGIDFRHKKAVIGISGKYTGEFFNPLYSSGSNRAEKTFDFKLNLRPVKKIKIGARVVCEKALVKGHNGKSPVSQQREDVSASYRGSAYDFLKLRLSCLQNTGDGIHEKRIQSSIQPGLQINDYLRVAARGLFQNRKGGGISASAGATVTVLYLRMLRLGINYTRFFVSGENRLYASVLPGQNSISSGGFIDQASNIAAVRFRVKWGKSFFSAGYQNHFTDSEEVKSRLDLSGRIVF